MNTKDSKLVSPKRQMWGAIFAPPFKERHTFSWHQLWIRPSKHCMSLSLSISPHNRDPCPILHRVTSETDFRDFSPRFPNDSHAKARFCSLPTCWWSQSWSCTRYCLQNFSCSFVVDKNMQKLQTYVWTPWPAPPVREGNSQWMVRERTVK